MGDQYPISVPIRVPSSEVSNTVSHSNVLACAQNDEPLECIHVLGPTRLSARDHHHLPDLWRQINRDSWRKAQASKIPVDNDCAHVTNIYAHGQSPKVREYGKHRILYNQVASISKLWKVRLHDHAAPGDKSASPTGAPSGLQYVIILG